MNSVLINLEIKIAYKEIILGLIWYRVLGELRSLLMGIMGNLFMWRYWRLYYIKQGY